MNSKNIIALLFLALLAACSSTDEKVDDEVLVEDLSGPATDSSSSTDTDSSATTYGTGSDSSSSLDPLDDPKNQLSVRIIYFEYDSSDIRSEFRPAIEAHAAYLAANPGKIVTLEGHADERGSREYNLALGERRAQSVKRQLSLLGASAGQIRTVSYGEERPQFDGHDESAWAENRRVVIIY